MFGSVKSTLITIGLPICDSEISNCLLLMYVKRIKKNKKSFNTSMLLLCDMLNNDKELAFYEPFCSI